MGQKAERRLKEGLSLQEPAPSFCWGCLGHAGFHLCQVASQAMAGVLCNEGYAGNMHCVGVEPESWVLASLQLVAVLG